MPNVQDRIKDFYKRAHEHGFMETAEERQDTGLVEDSVYDSLIGFFSPLGYRSVLMQEFRFLAKTMHISYMDFMAMPVSVRKFIIEEEVQDIEKANRQAKQSNRKYSGAH